MKKTLILTFVMVFFMSCSNDTQKDKRYKIPNSEKASPEFVTLDKQARQFFGALPEADPNLSEEQVALGKMLYFDDRLSKDNTQSCNTCHNLSTFGVDNKPFSEGNDGELGGRNSPTTLNAALHIAQFWDGREPDVEAQAGGPILNPVEMAMPDEETVINRLMGIKEYVELFSSAFPNEEKPITYENLKVAIGAFERKLLTPTKFDKYMAGQDNALNDFEKKGLQTFIQSGCITCHTGSLLGGNMFQKFGLYGNYWDFTKSQNIDNGKFDLTENEADKYIFKVPSLRNIEKTGPYFHDGSIEDLEEAVSIMVKAQLNKELTQEEVSEIIDFLKTLTGNVPEELMTPVVQ